MSSTVPFFGALTSTPGTATLQAALTERMWTYALDLEAGTVPASTSGSAEVDDLKVQR